MGIIFVGLYFIIIFVKKTYEKTNHIYPIFI